MAQKSNEQDKVRDTKKAHNNNKKYPTFWLFPLHAARKEKRRADEQPGRQEDTTRT